MSGWMSQTGRKAVRRRDLLLLQPGAAPPPPASSPGRSASECSCCTDQRTACKAASQATPSRLRPLAARSEMGQTLATGAVCPGRAGGSPKRGKNNHVTTHVALITFHNIKLQVICSGTKIKYPPPKRSGWEVSVKTPIITERVRSCSTFCQHLFRYKQFCPI